MSRDEVREISSMFIPITVEQLFVALVGILISFLVKNSGMEAVASVNLLNSVNQLFNQTFLAVGVGVSVVAAQYRGRGDTNATGRVAQQGVIIAVILAAAVGVICFLLREPILRLLLADSVPLIYEYSRTYLTYSLMALPFLGIYMVSSAAICGSGYARTSLIAVLVYNGSYAILASLATTFTDMGLLGVSRALLISAILAAIVGLTLLLRGNENLRIGRISLKFDKKVIKPMIKVGVPVLCENILFSLGRLITMAFSVPYGTNHMAANGIIGNINQIMCAPIMAAVNATPPIVGRYCGMGDNDGAMRKGKQLISLTIIIQVVISLLTLVFLVPLSKMMSDVLEVQTVTRQVLISLIITMPAGFTLAFVTPACMRSSGDAKSVLYINVLTMFTMRIGMAYVLSQVLRIGIIGIWIGMYCDWAVRICFFLPRFLSRKWLRYSLLETKKE